MTRQRYETIKDYITAATRTPYLFIRRAEKPRFYAWHGPCNRAESGSARYRGRNRMEKPNVFQAGLFMSGAFYFYSAVLYLAFRLSACHFGVAL